MLTETVMPQVADEPSVAQVDAEHIPDADPAVAPTFEQNDLVWAKIRGFPWWPARVAGTRRTDAEGVRYPVRFFHTAERIELSPMPSTLLPYSSREDLADPTKIKSKAMRTKFEKALLELSKEPTKGADEDPPEPPRPAELEESWRDEGHEYLGRRVARPFEGGLTVVGRITRWLPAGDGEDEPPLFHVDHDDGDEEDLEEYEVIDAFELYKTTPEATKLAQAKARAEARAAKEEEKAVKAEVRAAKASERAAAATTAEDKAAAEVEARAARLEVKACRAAALAARADTSGAEAAVAEAREEAMAAKAAFSKVAAKAKEAAARAREAKAKAAEEAKKKREAERGPRVAKTAVQFYTEAERLKLTAAHPGLDAPAIAEMIKAQWKVLEEADKAPYKELAAADKQRYEAECAASGIDPAAKRRKSSEGGAAADTGGAPPPPGSLASGTPRVVCALKSAPQLNGTSCVVLEWVPSEGRYLVRLDRATLANGESLVKLRPECLAATYAAALAATTAAAGGAPVGAVGASAGAGATNASTSPGADGADGKGRTSLPPGWTAVRRGAKAGEGAEGKGRAYTVYQGPEGKPQARSVKQAWEAYEKLSPGGGSAAAAAVAAAAIADCVPAEAIAEAGGAVKVRGAKTAFFLYSQARRREAREANPSRDAKAIDKLLQEEWKAAAPEARQLYIDEAAEDKRRYERELAAEQRRNSGGPSPPLSMGIPLQPLPQHSQPMQWKEMPAAPKAPPKPKTGKQLALDKLQAAKRAAQQRLWELSRSSQHETAPVAGLERPEPTGLLPLRDATLAACVLEVWLFARAFHKRLGLHPFQAHQLSAAVERGAESPLLVELSMALLRALLEQGDALRGKHQLPPPMSAALGTKVELPLQQLPPPELVTPTTWGEVLRAVGHLLVGFASNPDGEGAPAEEAAAQERARLQALAQLGTTPFAELPAHAQLTLLQALSDALLRTDEFTSELRDRFEQRAEAEANVAKTFKERQQRVHAEALAQAAADATAATAGAAGGAAEAAAISMLAMAAPFKLGEVGEAAEVVEAKARRAREAATEALLRAIEHRDAEALETAIESAAEAHHQGTLDDGRRWVTEELKTARALLIEEKARLRRQVPLDALALEQLQAHLQCAADHPTRETPLGKDSSGRTYWIFCHEPKTLWVADPVATTHDADSQALAETHAKCKAMLAQADRRAYVEKRAAAWAAKQAQAVERSEARGAAKAASSASFPGGDVTMAPVLRKKRMAAAASAREARQLVCELDDDDDDDDDKDEDEDEDEEADATDDGSGWSAPCEWRWARYERVAHVERLMLTLDGRSIAGSIAAKDEAALKKALAERLPDMRRREAEADEQDAAYDPEQLRAFDPERWRLHGHYLLGLRVATLHEGVLSVGRLTRWLPATDEDELFLRCTHDDNDGEDMSEAEALEAIRRLRRTDKVAVDEARLAGDNAYENTATKRALRWRPEHGVSLMGLRSEILDLEDGVRAMMRHAGAPWAKNYGERQCWLLSLKRATSMDELAPLLITFEAALHELGNPEKEVSERPPWRSSGDARLGKQLRRFFPVDEEDDEAEKDLEGSAEPSTWHVSDGKIVSWLPADGDDPALWHMIHHDGDEEDLEEYEVAFALAAAEEGLREPSEAERTRMHEERRKVLDEEARAKADADGDDDDEEDEKGATAPGDEDEEMEEGEEGEEGEGTGASTAAATATASSETLWLSKEARARWLGAVGASPSPQTLALCLAALKAHCQLFAPLQERKPTGSRRAELMAAVRCFYHAGAFGAKAWGAAKPAGQADAKGGAAVRFSNAEIRYLREGHRLFGRKGSDWIKQTLEQFAFHSSRNEKTLKQKWHQMGK
jgi:hypothetical protein